MRRRLFWALLLLVAVLGMHGLDCPGGDHEAMATQPLASTVALDGPHLDAAHAGHAADAPSTTQPGDATGAPAQPAHPSHAMLVCLAVLAVAVAGALIAWLALRRRRVPRPARRALRAVVDRALEHVPVPTLDRLCVLRI